MISESHYARRCAEREQTERQFEPQYNDNVLGKWLFNSTVRYNACVMEETAIVSVMFAMSALVCVAEPWSRA